MPVVIPELVWVVGLFFAVVGYLMARGSLATYTHSIGYLLKGLESVLKFSAGKGWAKITVDLGGPVRALDRAIVTALQNWCDGAEIQIGYCLHGMAKIARYTAQAIDFLARETADTFDWLVGIHLPKLLRYAVTALFPLPFLYRTIRHLIAAELPKVARLIHAGTHEVTTTINRTVTIPHLGELQWIHRHWKALTAAVAAVGSLTLPRHALWPAFWREWRTIEAWNKLTQKRIQRLEALLAASGLAVAVANMTGTRVSCWRGRGNIVRTLRHLCGTPAWLLDLLIVGSIEAFVASDLCGFSDLLIKQAETLRPALMELVDVEDALIGCHGTSKPLVFNLPSASLPPLQGVSPLAA